MANIYNEKVQCSHCLSVSFRMEKVVQFHERSIERATPFEREKELPAMHTEINYYCLQCNAKLNR